MKFIQFIQPKPKPKSINILLAELEHTDETLHAEALNIDDEWMSEL